MRTRQTQSNTSKKYLHVQKNSATEAEQLDQHSSLHPAWVESINPGRPCCYHRSPLSHTLSSSGVCTMPCRTPQTIRGQMSLEDLLGGSTVSPQPQPLWRTQSIPPHRYCKGREGDAVIKVPSAFPVIIRQNPGWKAGCKNSRAVS